MRKRLKRLNCKPLATKSTPSTTLTNNETTTNHNRSSADGGCATTQLLESPTIKAPVISIEAAEEGKIEAVKQHLASGTNVNLKNDSGSTP